MSRIGILYPGGLGATLGRAVVQTGGTPITCVSDRSEATKNRAIESGFIVRSSLEELVQECDLLISVVVPAAALEVAESIAKAVEAVQRLNCSTYGLLFVEANSISPQSKKRISNILSQRNIRCVDAAYFGPNNRIGQENVLALSGPASDEAADFLRPIVDLRITGQRVGDACELKMAMTIITKALPALFLEMVCASAAHGHLDSSLDLMRRLYPGILEFLERTLPTYPAHVARRTQELGEVVQWLDRQGQCGAMTRSAIEVLDRLRRANLEHRSDWLFEDLLRQIVETKILALNNQTAAE